MIPFPFTMSSGEGWKGHYEELLFDNTLSTDDQELVTSLLSNQDLDWRDDGRTLWIWNMKEIDDIILTDTEDTKDTEDENDIEYYQCPSCGYERPGCGCEEFEFADPTGHSALRAASPTNPRNLPCPTCRSPNRLTPKDNALGYQCDECADRQERGGY